jgi:hypothetical protein
MLPNKTKWTALLGCALALSGVAFAQSDSNQALLMLLVKKGIITQQEATELQQEAAATPPPRGAGVNDHDDHDLDPSAGRWIARRSARLQWSSHGGRRRCFNDNVPALV